MIVKMNTEKLIWTLDCNKEIFEEISGVIHANGKKHESFCALYYISAWRWTFTVLEDSMPCIDKQDSSDINNLYKSLYMLDIARNL